MRPSARHSTAGFTLIGLIVSIAIAAILAMLVVTSIGTAAAKVNANVASARLVSTLERARELAITGDADIVLCPSNNGTTCNDSDHWEHGWIGFADRHENGELSGGERVLLNEAALGNRVHLVSTQGRTRLRFQAVFGGNGGSNVTFTLCDARGARAATSWVLANNGRLHTAATKPANVAAACEN